MSMGHFNGPSKSSPSAQRLQDGEGWATGRHQLLITLLFVCEKWMRTSTRPSLGVCARLSLTWGLGRGLGCPVGVGGRAPPWGVGPAGRWVCALEIGICTAPRTRHMEVQKFPGTILVAWRRKGSRVTWRVAVQFRMC